MKLRPLAKNMTELDTGYALVLFSYSTPVAARIDGQYFRTSEKWSTTTSKHIHRWLEGATAEEKPQSFFSELGGAS